MRYEVKAYRKFNLCFFTERCKTIHEAHGWIALLKEEKEIAKIELYDDASKRVVNTYNFK